MDTQEIKRKAEEYISLEQDTEFRQDVENLVEKEKWEELNDRFYTELAFGTGGLRGVIGGGYNRINPFMINRATQGLANYIRKAADENNPKAVIAYDSRRYSDTFALAAALVLAGNGIQTFLFSSLRATPELSFAVRKLDATAGIVVTASHNPPEYNGYKVYWSDGGQIVPPHDKGIIEEVYKVSTEITSMDKEEALKKGMLKIIDKEIDNAFVEMIKKQSIRPQLVAEKGKDLKVVYTPLHGTGAMPVERIFSEMGIEVITVPEQREPDGNFPTVDFPNPEENSAMQMALDLGKVKNADIVMGTDPDSDRIGIAVPDKKGKYILITGNQLGALLTDYIFKGKKEAGTLPDRPAFIKTIVTTDLQRRIAESYGAECYDVLTGFKYIGEKIREFENQDNGPSYVFGGEESYGFLIETEARDKDAVSAAYITAEMALYHRSNGRSLLDALNQLYKDYGYFKEILVSKYFKGQSGKETMNNLMKQLREETPKTFGGQDISVLKDYKTGETTDMKTESKRKDIDLPTSNVIQFILTDGSIITARPSGTEPKIKFYASSMTEVKDDLDKAKEVVEEKISKIQNEINSLIPD